MINILISLKNKTFRSTSLYSPPVIVAALRCQRLNSRYQTLNINGLDNCSL
ncbi:hypothetical protein HMPREF0201_00942 [Cedecea davisae DSM 4568]|uniref:Uncharacterized protein n=1 Tax=Cedecea davisae DSM 4568 TaxID=566551 RepID=S3JG89_9ENTR|nr:hypothetical protein HMPREF0201_00942 [Cedecea davisae DSM 4568]